MVVVDVETEINVPAYFEAKFSFIYLFSVYSVLKE